LTGALTLSSDERIHDAYLSGQESRRRDDRGDWNAFRLGPLQSLCFDCHKRKWADDSHGYHCDIGDDGMPIDASHPFNQGGLVQHAPTDDVVVDIARDLVRYGTAFARSTRRNKS
jgi:hypothetical protein